MTIGRTKYGSNDFKFLQLKNICCEDPKLKILVAISMMRKINPFVGFLVTFPVILIPLVSPSS